MYNLKQIFFLIVKDTTFKNKPDKLDGDFEISGPPTRF